MIVLIIGTLGVVHRKFISGLLVLGRTKLQGRSLARYLPSLSVMIGSRRAFGKEDGFEMGLCQCELALPSGLV